MIRKQKAFSIRKYLYKQKSFSIRKILLPRAFSKWKSLCKELFVPRGNSFAKSHFCKESFPWGNTSAKYLFHNMTIPLTLYKEPFQSENPFTKSLLNKEVSLQRAFYTEPVQQESLFNKEMPLQRAFQIRNPFTKSFCTRQTNTKPLNKKP